MAAQSVISMSIQATGLPSGSATFAPPAVTLTPPVVEMGPISLAAGDNPLPVPAGAKYLGFAPPASNTNALVLKGAPGDVGTALSPSEPGTIPIDYPAGGTLYINAADSVQAEYFFS